MNIAPSLHTLSTPRSLLHTWAVIRGMCRVGAGRWYIGRRVPSPYSLPLLSSPCDLYVSYNRFDSEHEHDDLATRVAYRCWSRWSHGLEAPEVAVAVSQILGNPLDHSLYLALSWLVVRIHWAGFGVWNRSLRSRRPLQPRCLADK